MHPHSIDHKHMHHISAARRGEIMHELASIASTTANSQIDAFALRLSDALMKMSEMSGDAKEAKFSFNAANVLKNNGYAFYYLASGRLGQVLVQEVEALEHVSAPGAHEKSDDMLSLVPYEVMDKNLLLANMSRAHENKISEQLAALGIRLAYLLGKDELPVAQNPFRPAVFLSAVHDAWCEFDPDTESHPVVLPLLRPDIFLDLLPIIKALNQDLIDRGVLPELSDSYRIKKSNANQEAAKKENQPALLQQLQHLFSPGEHAAGVKKTEQLLVNHFSAEYQNQMLQAAVNSQLLGYLANVQKNMSQHAGLPGFGGQPDTALLTNIKAQAPRGALTRVDEHTIDLLAKVFDVVFHNQDIPSEIKPLISLLQVPVLKTALADKDFFFKEEHPARRLIELLAKYSVAWDQKKGTDDPFYQTVQRNIKRVEEEMDHKTSVFSDVVSDLESFIQEEETTSIDALSTPINEALREEKLGQARKAAKTEVALRIGTGEVVAFVEGFLENKWVPVLTLAYSVQDEKPEVVKNAIQTMDNLIWSVKPKITKEQRKELLTKLPSMLSALNKWLNLINWEDVDRLQFFAELAECHASIMRAPLELSPQRQLEISIEAAKNAAERRLEKRAAAEPEAPPDEFDQKTERIERGTWMEYTPKGSESKRVKLAWVSPMRSLYIFTTKDKSESFSISAEELAQAFREERARAIPTGGLVDRALAQAIENMGANDAMVQSVA